MLKPYNDLLLTALFLDRKLIVSPHFKTFFDIRSITDFTWLEFLIFLFDGNIRLKNKGMIEKLNSALQLIFFCSITI